MKPIKYIFILCIIQLGCKTATKFNDDNTNSEKLIKCNYKGNNCDSIFYCYQNYFYSNPIAYDTFSKKVDLSTLMSCAKNLMKAGDIKGKNALINYYSNLFKQDGADVMNYYNFIQTFKGMIDQEVFDLAMLYASKTKCHSSDVIWEGDGNIGINVIEYIINPMIKSVGGEFDMSMYLYVDNYKNRSVKPTSSDPCIASHEVNYGELIKAYKEGKIVLKKYGDK